MEKKEQTRIVVEAKRKNKHKMMTRHFRFMWRCSEQSARHFPFKHRVNIASEKLTRDEAARINKDFIVFFTKFKSIYGGTISRFITDVGSNASPSPHDSLLVFLPRNE